MDQETNESYSRKKNWSEHWTKKNIICIWICKFARNCLNFLFLFWKCHAFFCFVYENAPCCFCISCSCAPLLFYICFLKTLRLFFKHYMFSSTKRSTLHTFLWKVLRLRPCQLQYNAWKTYQKACILLMLHWNVCVSLFFYVFFYFCCLLFMN